MSSAAFTEIVRQNTLNIAHGAAHKFARETGSTPIVFVVVYDTSDREMLELFIQDNGWCSETFASVQEFLAHPPALVPSTLILEVAQDRNGLEIQKRLAAERPEMPVILITSHSDVRTAVRAIKAGAIEFLTRPVIDDLLLSAIQQAHERSRIALARQADMRVLKECYRTLTPRERQVLALVVCGMLNKQVGGELGISEITVKAHRGRMMQKMKANSLADLVKMAAKLRIPGPEMCATLSPNVPALRGPGQIANFI
jgi:FixJ family two-component response regulator